MSPKPSVLFVCVHNAGKSQMAAALMRLRSEGAVEVISGGTDPGKELNDAARSAISELGASMDGEFPKAITEQDMLRVNRIVICGSEAKLEAVPGMRGKIETWLTAEPTTQVGDKVAQARLVRDDIAVRVEKLFHELITEG